MKKGWLVMGLMAAVIAFGFNSTPAFAVGGVAGIVTDADGNPVANAQVMIQSAERVRERGQRPYMNRFQTGENGEFGWRDVPAGQYFVQASARAVGAARAQIEVVDDHVTRCPLQLQGRNPGGGGEERAVGGLQGVVVNADGEGVAGAMVMLIPTDRGNRMRARGLHLRTDENGAFGWERLPAGNYRIVAGARQVGRARAEVAIAAGQVTEIRLVLQMPE